MHEIPLREFKKLPRVATALVETCDSVESLIETYRYLLDAQKAQKNRERTKGLW